ncbi:ATP-binding protein [Streptomyces sp. NPDC058892]|uniref:ATP-binding protein n=1 Tax=unclassified Streptomyces TaxID=2593676 RepID=UPI00044BB311|nr:ATP-binding protein [Streptomyces sp. PCS3-D2]WKV72618.1 ATP-binding protein [Streptomyces sp. PCS3-D2]
MPATVSPSWAYSLQLPQDPRAPGLARQTLRSVLRTHAMSALVETAELLAGELLANAYLYSDGPYTLRLRAMGSTRLRVSVWDSNPHIPPPFGADSPVAAPRPGAERGRGLFLVRAYAANWGGYPLGGTGLYGKAGGKLLWVEVHA